MSTSAAVASEFLRVQNASAANGTVVNGSTSWTFVPQKQLAKPRFMQDLSRIKPQMMQKVLSSIGLSEDKKADFALVNRQAEDFNGQSEESSHREMLELFPISTGSGLGSNPRVTENKITLPFAIGQTDPDSSSSAPAKAPEQQSTAQLTIFYNGAMNVYDVSAEKAQAIMRLASANSSRKTRISTISSSKIEQVSKPLPSKPASNAANGNQPQTPPVGLEIAKKLSLQSFLRKRKERFNSVAPYTTMKPATLPSKAEKESDDQIRLSLASSSQNFKMSVNAIDLNA
jgi:hypothetical protein